MQPMCRAMSRICWGRGKVVGTVIQSLWNGGQALIDMLAVVVITPVVAFYLLYDWDRMVAKIDGWLPRVINYDPSFGQADG